MTLSDNVYSDNQELIHYRNLQIRNEIINLAIVLLNGSVTGTDINF